MESVGLGRILLIEFGDCFPESLASLTSLRVYRIPICIVMTLVRLLDAFRVTHAIQRVFVEGGRLLG